MNKKNEKNTTFTKWVTIFSLFVVFIIVSHIATIYVPQSSELFEDSVAYVALEGSILPGNGEIDDYGSYFENIYDLGLGIAGVLAVLMIVIAGVKYMTTEAVGSKQDAKEQIQAALLGLLLALASYLILQTIDEGLVSFEIKLPKSDLPAIKYERLKTYGDRYGDREITPYSSANDCSKTYSGFTDCILEHGQSGCVKTTDCKKQKEGNNRDNTPSNGPGLQYSPKGNCSEKYDDHTACALIHGTSGCIKTTSCVPKAKIETWCFPFLYSNNSGYESICGLGQSECSNKRAETFNNLKGSEKWRLEEACTPLKK